MNYRHAYHAGNFADVAKHVILTRVIAYMQAKEKPLFLLDTHAGTGAYDLASEEAGKTGEAEGGIKRLLAAADGLEPPVRTIIDPYLKMAAAVAGTYPGSPAIMASKMRPQDRAAFFEKHPTDAATLAGRFSRSKRIKVHGDDGWTALKAMLPPPERRAVVLVDPPFEEKGEFNRLVQGLQAAMKRFATGTYLLWYPVKDSAEVLRFRDSLEGLGIERLSDTRFLVDEDNDANGFRGSGMAIVNAPFSLEAELSIAMPALVRLLERRPGAGAWTFETVS